jgi:hypothetical protein
MALVQTYETLCRPTSFFHHNPLVVDEYERLLYNTIRFELKETIQGYFQRIHKNYPIHVIFDMSDVKL